MLKRIQKVVNLLSIKKKHCFNHLSQSTKIVILFDEHRFITLIVMKEMKLENQIQDFIGVDIGIFIMSEDFTRYAYSHSKLGNIACMQRLRTRCNCQAGTICRPCQFAIEPAATRTNDQPRFLSTSVFYQSRGVINRRTRLYSKHHARRTDLRERSEKKTL